MSKPLWEMYVIEGLDNVEGVPAGSYATLTKTHHAAMDGTSGMEMLSALHDQEPGTHPQAPAGEWRPGPEPTPFELMARASFNNMMRPARLAATMSRVFGGSQALTRQALAGEVQLPPPLAVPSTIFNANVSAHRVFEGRRFSLDRDQADQDRGARGHGERCRADHRRRCAPPLPRRPLGLAARIRWS